MRSALVLLAALLAVLGAATTASATAPTTATAVARAATADDHPVLLVGVAGVRWDDVDQTTTPALWELSRTASVGLVATRAVSARSCPADGWLTVSAGIRAADERTDDGACLPLDEPDGGDVPRWSEYRGSASSQSYGAKLGLLGDRLADAGTTTTAIGPGAAIALAGSDGSVTGDYEALPADASGITDAVRSALGSSRLVVVDAGAVQVPVSDEPLGEAALAASRAPQVHAIDERVGAAIAAAPGDATVLVVSLATEGRSTLQLAAATGPAPRGGTYADDLLTSGSTQQDGLIQVIDVTPTLLESVGLDEGTLPGATISPTPGPASADDRVDGLIDIQRHAGYASYVSGGFTTRVVVLDALLFAAAAAVLLVLGGAGITRRTLLRVLQVAATALAAGPVAGFLAGLVPWWRAEHPTPTFRWTVLGFTAVIAAIALVGPWRRTPWGPVGVVAGLTVGTLAIDAVTGSHLVIDAPWGAQRLVAARFYGMSNQGFALLVAAGPILAAAVAAPLLRRGRRGVAVASTAGLGLVLIVVDGAPGFGSDFGGPPALLVAFALLTAVVAGRRVTWRAAVTVCVVGALVVGAFAFADYLRPADSRTHVGRFVATALDGGLWDTLDRKISTNISLLTSWRYLLLTLSGVAITWLVLRASRRGPLTGLDDAVPLLRATVAAIGAGLLVGFLINDSGIVIPAAGFSVAVPCLVALVAQWRRTAPAPPSADVPGSRADE